MMNKREQKIIDWINRILTKYGSDPITELVGGEPGDSEHCVIAENLAEYSNLVGVDVIPNEAIDDDGNYILKWNETMRYGYADIEVFDGNRLDSESIRIWLPKYVAQFAVDFDNGKFPHLDTLQ